MLTIGFIGSGNMACALGGGLRLPGSAAGPTRLVATDVEPGARARFEKETGGTTFASAGEVLRESDVVVLAVKPQVLPAVLADLAPLVEDRHLFVSIAAGASLDTLERGLGGKARVVRAMPNTPALVREGMTVLVAGRATRAGDVDLAERIFRAAGDVAVVDDESLLDPVTALSGSGPGFLFAYAEAMLRAGEQSGLPPELAKRLLQKTLIGSAILWRESSEPVEKLRANVTSPGGTTQAGLEALAAGGFARAIGDAVLAATRRSRELSGGGGSGSGGSAGGAPPAKKS